MHFVRRYRHSDTGAADQDRSVGITAGHTFCDLEADLRVSQRILGGWHSAIRERSYARVIGQSLHQILLQRVSGFIASDLQRPLLHVVSIPMRSCP
jgi:hypothetical protein